MCSTSAMLSNFGKIRFGQKSLLLSCLDSWWLYIQGFSSAKYLMVQLLFTSYHLVQSKLFQNMPTVSLSPSSCNNYSKHLELIVCGRCTLQIASRKLYTRDHRGHGTRTKVSGQTKMPKKWNDFFKGFKELICFQGLWGWYSWRIHYIRYVIATVNNIVFFLSQETLYLLALGTEQEPMVECNHEEADTRNGSTHDGFTGERFQQHHDSYSQHWCDSSPLASFMQFKRFTLKPTSGLLLVLERISVITSFVQQSWKREILLFASISCIWMRQHTSSFFSKTKRSAWAAWNSFPEVHIIHHRFDPESSHFKLLERFTIILYDRTSILESVNEAQKEQEKQNITH